MSDPVYELSYGQTQVTKDGHVMFMADVVKDLKALQYKYKRDLATAQARIKELEEQVKRLKANDQILQILAEGNDKQAQTIKELREQVKGMRCCGNCTGCPDAGYVKSKCIDNNYGAWQGRQG